MKKNRHYMVDIETTGVKEEDSILEIGMVEIGQNVYDFWVPTGRELREVLHYPGDPQTVFAKENMALLYKECNLQPIHKDYAYASTQVREFIHPEGEAVSNGPKKFMGWNASNFDMEFLFKKGILTRSFYDEVDGEEVLKGDAHYRVYEQTGALQVCSDVTGFDRKTILSIAKDLNPTGLQLPTGKLHDALYDCYNQIIMMNGIIDILKKGWKK